MRLRDKSAFRSRFLRTREHMEHRAWSRVYSPRKLQKDEGMPLLWFLPMIMLSAMFDVSSREALERTKQVRDFTGGLLS